MIEVFIHEEYVNKRQEQKKQQQQLQRRRRPHMRALQIETGKLKLPPATAAAPGQHQQRPRDHQNQQAAADVPRSPVGSPTADAATFRDHLFDYLKPY